MHMRLLAPDAVDRIAHPALDCARQEIRVAPLAARQAFEDLEDRRVDDLVEPRAFARALGEARDHHVRVARHLALRRQRDRDRDDAREGESAPLRHAFLVGRQENHAVLQSPAAKRTRSPLKARRTCGTPCALAKATCSLRCSGSPWAGTAIFGLSQAYIFASSALRGWPETCTSALRSVITSTPPVRKALTS